MPGVTPCFECTIWLFPPQVKFPLCTLAETPRTAAHCIEYAHLIKWDEVNISSQPLVFQTSRPSALLFHPKSFMQAHSGKTFDPDDPEHMQWVYSEVAIYVFCFLHSYFLSHMQSFLMFFFQPLTSSYPCAVGC